MSVRFGLVGTGPWAGAVHAPALAAHPGVQFVGVWGRDPAKTAALAGSHDVRAFESADDLLDAVDAVAMAIPPSVQADLALLAAEAGRHLLLEKPLSLSTESADRIVATVDRQRLASVTFFTLRFNPGVDAFLGEAERAGGWHSATGVMYASIYRTENPGAASPWRRQEGGLWDLGPHALSVVLPVLGPVTEVAAMDGADDTVHVLLRHAGGAATTLGLTLDAPPAAHTQKFTFYGSSGVAALPAADGSPIEALTRAIDALVREIGGGGLAHPCDVRFGRDVVAILAAVDAARKVGKSVRLNS